GDGVVARVREIGRRAEDGEALAVGEVVDRARREAVRLEGYRDRAPRERSPADVVAVAIAADAVGSTGEQRPVHAHFVAVDPGQRRAATGRLEQDVDVLTVVRLRAAVPVDLHRRRVD